MSPELIAAVKERIQLGHPTEAIRSELQAAGYTDEIITQVLQVAAGQGGAPVPPVPPPVAMVDTTELVLPGAWELFKRGIQRASKRLDLVALLVAPFILAVIFKLVLFSPGVISDGSLGVLAVSALGVLVMVLLNVLLTATALRITTAPPTSRLSIAEGLAWAKTKMWGWWWVAILTVLAIYGGLLLFIIPGIIVSLYIFFAQYAYVIESERGLRALMRSRELVRGYWWPLAGRFLVILILFIIVFLIAGVALGIVSTVAGFSSDTPTAGTLVVGLFYQGVGTFITVVGLFIGAELFHVLAAKRPSVPNAEYAGTGKYRVLVILGLLLPVMLVVLVVILASLNTAQETGREVMLKSSMSNARSQAEIFWNEHDFTYQGVCDELSGLISGGSVVACQAGTDHWAMTAVSNQSDHTQYCVSDDSFVPGGSLSPEGTACLPATDAKTRADDLRSRLGGQ